MDSCGPPSFVEGSVAGDRWRLRKRWDGLETRSSGRVTERGDSTRAEGLKSPYHFARPVTGRCLPLVAGDCVGHGIGCGEVHGEVGLDQGPAAAFRAQAALSVAAW
jgi:hypothetical protein